MIFDEYFSSLDKVSDVQKNAYNCVVAYLMTKIDYALQENDPWELGEFINEKVKEAYTAGYNDAVDKYNKISQCRINEAYQRGCDDTRRKTYPEGE